MNADLMCQYIKFVADRHFPDKSLRLPGCDLATGQEELFREAGLGLRQSRD